MECSEVCDWELVVCWWSLWSITPVPSPPPSRSLLLSHISFPPSVLSISVSPSPTLQMLNSVKSPVYPINRSITDVSIHFKIFFKHCIINVKDIWNHCEPTEKVKFHIRNVLLVVKVWPDESVYGEFTVLLSSQQGTILAAVIAHCCISLLLVSIWCVFKILACLCNPWEVCVPDVAVWLAGS